MKNMLQNEKPILFVEKVEKLKETKESWLVNITYQSVLNLGPEEKRDIVEMAGKICMGVLMIVLSHKKVGLFWWTTNRSIQKWQIKSPIFSQMVQKKIGEWWSKCKISKTRVSWWDRYGSSLYYYFDNFSLSLKKI